MPINEQHSDYAVTAQLHHCMMGSHVPFPYFNNSNDEGAVDRVRDNAIVVALKIPISSHGIGTMPSCRSIPYTS